MGLGGYASRSLSSSPPVRRLATTHAARTPSPAQGAMGREWRLVVAWIASPAVIGAICWRCRRHAGSDQLGSDGREVEQAEHGADRHGGVAEDRGDAEREQGDEDQVEHGADRGAQGRTMVERYERVPVGGVESGVGEQKAADDEAAGRPPGPTGTVRPARLAALAASRLSARHGGEGGSDHAGAVFLGHGQHGEDGDHDLAEVDAGEAELGGIGLAALLVCRRGDDGADRDGDADAADDQPGGGGQGAEFGPLGSESVDHASLRCSSIVAAASASRA